MKLLDVYRVDGMRVTATIERQPWPDERVWYWCAYIEQPSREIGAGGRLVRGPAIDGRERKRREAKRKARQAVGRLLVEHHEAREGGPAHE